MFVFRVCAVVNLCLSESVNLHTIANTVQKRALTTSNIWVVFTHTLDVGNRVRDVETVYIQDAIRALQSVLQAYFGRMQLKCVDKRRIKDYKCRLIIPDMYEICHRFISTVLVCVVIIPV